MTKLVPVTMRNVSKIDCGHMCAFSFAAGGAMGAPGHIDIFMDDGDSFDLRYLDDRKTLDRFCEIFPTIHALLSFEPVKGWKSIYVGMGNALLIRDNMFEQMKNEGVDFADPMNALDYLYGGYTAMDKGKSELYRNLIDDVRASYLNRPSEALQWCDECKDEINLWTYWQGKGNLDPDILLVGQDWGDPASSQGKSSLKALTGDRPYLEVCHFKTDRNLALLFSEGLDIDISKPNDRLFFTNLVLGYRKHNNSGSLGKGDIERDLGFFARLVGILRPKKAIICLGKDTFNGALKALGLKPHEGSLNEMLNDEDGKGNWERFGDIKIFGVAHPGYFGCLNRVGGPRSKHNAEEGLLKEVEDWKKMAARL